MSESTIRHEDPKTFAELTGALKSELEQLQQSRNEVTLGSGEQVGSFAGRYFYRFEIPENIFLAGVLYVTGTPQNHQVLNIPGTVVALHNQYLTLALPVDFGDVLPELKCSWDYVKHLSPLISAFENSPDQLHLSRYLIHPQEEGNKLTGGSEPALPSSMAPHHKEAVKRALRHRVAYLAGPIRSGKSTLLAFLIAHFIKSGKRILYAASDGEQVDESLRQLLKISREFSIDAMGVTTRVGLSVNKQDETLAALSHERAIEAQRNEKKRAIWDKVSLLDQYWKVAIRQSLHQDYYSKLADLEERVVKYNKQLETAEKEVTAAKEAVARVEGASMLDRLKKGFSKDDAVAAQRQQKEKDAAYKRILTNYQAVKKEIMKWEVRAPISNEEMKAYWAAHRDIEKLGGVEKLTKEVEQAIVVDEAALLNAKSFVATTVTDALHHPVLSSEHFDVVIVDDAEAAPIPSLVMLSGRAKEQMIVAGDPFQPGLESITNSPSAQEWLQRSIFSLVLQTDEFEELLAAGDGKREWFTLLNTQFDGGSKFAHILGPILFQDKISLNASSKGKGSIVFVDTSALKSTCKQYLGKKKILPHNNLHTRKVLELVKHAMLEPHRLALEVGVVYPFSGPTLYAKQQLRMQGIRNVEVGTPVTFHGRKKKAIIFDTTMAGVDYTMRAIDDKKVGQSTIARMLYGVLACAEGDVYIVADLSHFKLMYSYRLVTKLLQLLQAESDQVSTGAAAKKFDALEWDRRALHMVSTPDSDTGSTELATKQTKTKMDTEVELRMKMKAKKGGEKPQIGGRDFVKETYQSVHRVLGLLDDVNLLAQYIGGDVLFRRSLATEAAAARLPIDLCEREEDFSAAMEHWNLLIYEMSGASRTDSTYFAKQTPEARVRWDVNNLKAFYGTDIQAVIEEGKQRIAVAVSKLFQDAVNKAHPSSPIEWSTTYIYFLSKLEAYLEWISEQMRK